MQRIKALFTLSLLIVITALTACERGEVDPLYRQRMKDFVQALSEWAKAKQDNFIIIPQNGPELVTLNGEENGEADPAYLNAIDGVGREDLYYGYRKDNDKTPERERDYMIAFLDICEINQVEVLTTDYCSDHDKMDNSYIWNSRKSYISFAAPFRDLDRIPDYPIPVFNENSNDIENLSQAENFLYLIDPGRYEKKSEFLAAIQNTNYDLIIIDLFFGENEQLEKNDITSLKVKNNGGKRLVIAYMSIGEAEDYRYYWKSSWKPGSPEWIEKENPDWEGNYKVKYWASEWQALIFGTENSYLDRILTTGFDGVYLDIIDAFEYFE